LCLRPEAVGLAGSVALGQARLVDAAFFGTHYRSHFAPLAAPDLRLVAHLAPGALPQLGSVHALYASAHAVVPA
jgi:spermidine/putrescine transport system ATP-binding protein